MFDSKDKDLDGRLSFKEFMGEASRAERLFKLMDKDGDGYVTKHEFKDVCKNLNKEQVEAAFKRFDQTGNEKLNFKEFSNMMTKRSDSKRNIVKTKTEARDRVDGAGATREEPSELEENKEEESPRNND